MRSKRNVTVVLPTAQYTKLKRTCRLRGEDVSTFIRRTVYEKLASLGLLREEEKKALGVS